MIVLQGIIISLILLVWLSLYLQMRAKKINFGEFILWSALWLFLLLASILPSMTSKVSSWVGIGRGVDLITYGSIFLIFYLMFKLYVRMEAQEREITSLVRALSIRKAKKPK